MDDFILRSINKHGQVRHSLSPASVSTLLKEIQQRAFKNVEPNLSGHSFRVGAALDLLNNGLPWKKSCSGVGGDQKRPL